MFRSFLGKKRLDTTALNNSGYLFSIPDYTLEDIPQEECYIRVQGGSKGLLVSEPPHLVMNASWKYVVYSDEYFLVKPRQIGLSVPKEDADYLRALSVFLSSDIVRYYLFFQTPSYGIERDRITLHDVKSIPVPILTSTQIEEMVTVQKSLPQMEIEQGSEYTQAYLDKEVIRILQIPESITTLVTEFIQVRSRLVGGGTKEAVQEVSQRPNQKELQDYAQQLITDLDGFLSAGKTHHRVIVEQSPELICCTVEFVKSDDPFTPIVKAASSRNGHIFTRLSHVDEYWSIYRQHIHTLLAWGYADSRHRVQVKHDEIDITGFIAEAIQNRLEALDSPLWCDQIALKDDPPIPGGGRTGRQRWRPDLIFESVERRPRPNTISRQNDCASSKA